MRDLKFPSGITLFFCLLVSLLFAYGVTRPVQTNDRKSSNVLIISLDAARADHFGVYGYPLQTTPEIDKICKQSLVFDRAFAVAPYTVASVASLFTSLYPDTHAVLDHGNRLADTIPTLAESFKKAGYKTLLFGNSPFLAPAFGVGRGFDVSEPEIGNGVDRSETLTKRVNDELGRVQPPFFCYVHYVRPHEPYDAPADIRAIFGRGRQSGKHDLESIRRREIQPDGPFRRELIADYDASLRTADREIGKLFECITEEGLLNDTVVIILSDHGEAFGEHGQYGHNSTVYKEMVQIPLILHYPKTIKPGRTPDLAQTVDIFPTLSQLTGISLPKLTQGKSLLDKKSRDYAFSRTAGTDPIFAVRTSKAMMVRNSSFESFYDLQSDPMEQWGIRRDRIAGAKATQLNQLESVFARWLGFCLANNRGVRTIALDPELLSRLKSFGYLQ